MALGSFDEALDADTVLWAVRGMSGAHVGVSAEDVTRFLSKDTTLSVQYDRDDVTELLDSLAAEGALNYEPATGVWSTDEMPVIVEANTPWPPREGTGDAFLRLQLEELERERDALGAERDEWRQRAESAERDAFCEQTLGNELRAQVRELEGLLERERAIGEEKSETARRAALALALARHELERIDVIADPAPPPTARPRRALRGNWLE